MKIRQSTDVCSKKGKGVKRSASTGEEEAETSAAKDKEGDKDKKDKKKDKGRKDDNVQDNAPHKRDKAAHEYRKGHKAHKPEQFQRITGKRFCES